MCVGGQLISMSELENILAFIFLLNWRIIWNLERQQIPCNEDWHLLFFPVSSTHRQTIHHSPARVTGALLLCFLLQPRGWSHDERQAAGRHPFEDDRTRMPVWTCQAYGRAVSSRVMTSFCRQRSSPGRLHHGIVPLKVISALTYVIRSNGSVFTFHTEQSSFSQPTLKLKLLPWCGGKINCPPQPGCA